MIEVCAVHKVPLVLIERNDLDLVQWLLDKRPKREAHVLLWPVTEVDAVQVPLRLMSVDLLPLCPSVLSGLL